MTDRNPFDTLRENPFEDEREDQLRRALTEAAIERDHLRAAVEEDDEQARADAWVLETAIERGLLSEADAIALQIEGAAKGYQR